MVLKLHAAGRKSAKSVKGSGYLLTKIVLEYAYPACAKIVAKPDYLCKAAQNKCNSCFFKEEASYLPPEDRSVGAAYEHNKMVA